MSELTDEIDVDEDGQYRYRDYTGDDGVYASVPCYTDGQLIWYPPDGVERAVEHETWTQLLVATAGADDELRAEVYLDRAERFTMGVMRFSDPDDSFGVVAEIEAVQDVVKTLLTTPGWRNEDMSTWLSHDIGKAIIGELGE